MSDLLTPSCCGTTCLGFGEIFGRMFSFQNIFCFLAHMTFLETLNTNHFSSDFRVKLHFPVKCLINNVNIALFIQAMFFKSILNEPAGL